MRHKLTTKALVQTAKETEERVSRWDKASRDAFLKATEHWGEEQGS